MSGTDEPTAQRTPNWVIPLLLAALLVVVVGVILAIVELAGQTDILLATQPVLG